jgi:hypothetical protein
VLAALALKLWRVCLFVCLLVLPSPARACPMLRVALPALVSLLLTLWRVCLFGCLLVLLPSPA